MDNNANYKKGIDFVIQEIQNETHLFKEISQKIKDEQGEEAYRNFTSGYYKALTYFTHAINHCADNPKDLQEIIDDIQNNHGEDIKAVFLMGLEYYKTHEEEIAPYKPRKQ